MANNVNLDHSDDAGRGRLLADGKADGAGDVKELWHEVRPYLWVWATVLLIVWVVLHGALVFMRDNQVEACLRGNATRAHDFRDDAADAAAATQLAAQTHDPEQAAIWRDVRREKDSRMAEMVQAAENTGSQTVPGGVTLDCEDLIPDVPTVPGL